MSSLENQVNQSFKDLKNSYKLLTQMAPQSLDQSVIGVWTNRSLLYVECEHTIPIFLLRDKALIIMNELLRSQGRDKEPNVVKYCSFDMDFSIARNHAVTAYMMANWSIYDRLSNIAGRLVGTGSIFQNPKDNPKLVEDFMNKKDRVPYLTHHLLSTSYRWPVMVSYKIRNWLAHEGYDIGNISLFKGNRVSDGFILHPDAMETIQKNNDYKLLADGRIQNSCIDPSSELWLTGDLFQILESYHSVIDDMLASLLKWSSDAFVNHLKCFVPHP